MEVTGLSNERLQNDLKEMKGNIAIFGKLLRYFVDSKTTDSIILKFDNEDDAKVCSKHIIESTTRLPPFVSLLRSYRIDDKFLESFLNIKLASECKTPLQEEYKGYSSIIDVFEDKKKVSIYLSIFNALVRSIIITW